MGVVHEWRAGPIRRAERHHVLHLGWLGKEKGEPFQVKFMAVREIKQTFIVSFFGGGVMMGGLFLFFLGYSTEML